MAVSAQEKVSAAEIIHVFWRRLGQSNSTGSGLAIGGVARSYGRGLSFQFITHVNVNRVIYFKRLSLAVAAASIFRSKHPKLGHETWPYEVTNGCSL